MTSVHDGFGGFTCGLLENIRDEYPKASILTYGISDMQPSSTQVHIPITLEYWKSVGITKRMSLAEKYTKAKP